MKRSSHCARPSEVMCTQIRDAETTQGIKYAYCKIPLNMTEKMLQ